MRFLLLSLCAITCLNGCAQPSPRTGVEREPRPDSPLQAARFRYAQRLDENGVIADNALVRAKQQRDAMIAGGLSSGADSTWTWIGPGNIGGRLRAIVIHPSQPNTMWVGTAGGGIWKTTNGGASWSPLDDFMASLSVSSLLMKPDDPNVLYAGTGEGFFETVEGSSNTAAIRGAGIFKTTDGGVTWTQIPSTANPDFYFVNRLAVQPGNPLVLLSANAAGMFRSTDGGDTWAKVNSSYFYDVQFHPTDGNKAVAGRHDATPMYTNDGGVTWLAATGANGHRNEVRYAKSNPSIVYAAVSDNGLIRVHRSTNGGQSYTLMTSGNGISTYEAYNNVLWVDPTTPTRLILGGVSLYRSTDSGTTFSGVFGNAHADHHAIVEDPGFNGSSNRIVYFGTDGGVYRTNDAYASSVTALNNNLGITQFYGAAVNDASGVVLAGAQDNGTSRYAGDPQAWTAEIGGDGGYCAADHTNPNYFYGETQRLAIRRSADGGLTFNQITSGLSDAGTLSTNFIPYFCLDVNDPNRMLAAAARLWRCNNVKAATPAWAIIKPSIAPAPPPDPIEPLPAHMVENSPYNISTIAVAEGNSNIIWVGYNNGEVWYTTNGTATSPAWTRVDANGVGLPDRWIGRIVIDRFDHARVYVSLMGYTAGNVWKTVDGGQTWQSASGSGLGALPAMPVSALAKHRTVANRLYAGTDLGLFQSNDDGATWAPIVPGVGTVSVDELVWRNDTTLMAVTHGRGVYFGDVSAPGCVGDIDGDGKTCQSDLGVLLAAYGTCEGDPGYNAKANLATTPAPFCGGSGQGIDQADLGVLLADFGCGGCP